MKDKDIVRYTRHDLPKGKTHWVKVETMSEEEIETSAKTDLDNPRWTKKMLKSAVLNMPKKKVHVNIFLDKDIVDWFKSDGKGYQTRINSVLKSYVHKHI